MFLTFRQRKTSSSGTGCCTSILYDGIAQFHGSHLQAKKDEQQRNWIPHEHCSVSCFSLSGKGRRAAAELDAARALLSFMLLTCRQRKTNSNVTGCCTNIAQFHGSQLQAKEDEQNRMMDEHRMALLNFMVLNYRQRKTSRTGCWTSI
jgi:hypothetical protein